MIFDDSFFLLSDDDDEENKDAEWTSTDDTKDKTSNDDSESLTEESDEVTKPAETSTRGRWTGGGFADFTGDLFDTPSSEDDSISDSSSDRMFSDNSDLDYAIETDLVMPTIKPVKAVDAKPTILAIDDDFSTLDLMKIYFSRDYDYVSFSGPREAIFYLNEHVVDLIFLDCYIHTIKAARVVDIIHSYKELANVPIVYLCDDYEYGAIYSKLPNGVNALIQRPVSRKSIQDIIDRFLPKKN